MTERLHTVSDERLGMAISSIELDWPPTPDLVAAVAARVASDEEAGAARARLRRRWPRAVRRPVFGMAPRAALAAVLVAVVAATGLAAAVSSDVRAALKDLLGISGAVRIERVDRLPDLSPARDLGLGARTTLAAARRGSAFPVRVPRSLGAPDAVYRSSAAPGGVVTLVYLAGDGLPATSGQVGLLLMALPGRGDIGFAKLVEGGVGVERVRVGSARGFWIDGPHGLVYADREGEVREESPRLAGRTLVWTTADGVTYRLESGLGKAAALGVARSVR